MAIIAAGSRDLYYHSKPPLTSGKLCFIINFIGRPQGAAEFYWGAAVPLIPSLNRPCVYYMCVLTNDQERLAEVQVE